MKRKSWAWCAAISGPSSSIASTKSSSSTGCGARIWAQIVDIQFRRLSRLLEDRKITLTLDAKGRQWLAEKGYDPTYGARPLKRVIQKWVQDPLAQMLLAGEIRDGATVKISAARGRLTINGKEVGDEPDESSQPKSPSVVQFPKT